MFSPCPTALLSFRDLKSRLVAHVSMRARTLLSDFPGTIENGYRLIQAVAFPLQISKYVFSVQSISPFGMKRHSSRLRAKYYEFVIVEITIPSIPQSLLAGILSFCSHHCRFLPSNLIDSP